MNVCEHLKLTSHRLLYFCNSGDSRLSDILTRFELKSEPDDEFLEKLHELILSESEETYNDLFCETSLEVGKSLSKVSIRSHTCHRS